MRHGAVTGERTHAVSAEYPDTSAKSSTAGMGAQQGGTGGFALAAERATRRGT